MSSATTGSPTSVPAPIAVPPSGRSMASRPYAGFGECAISECIQTYNFPFCPFGTNFPARGISIINDRRQFLGTADMSVDYPIAIDSDYAIWRAFNNEYWPALYFVDAQGRIRHHEFGEGNYEQSEMIIQALLRDAGVAGLGDELVSVDARGAEVPAD